MTLFLIGFYIIYQTVIYNLSCQCFFLYNSFIIFFTVSTDMKFDIGITFFDFMCCFKELFYAFCFHYASYVNKSNRFFFPWVWKWNKFF